MLFYKPFKLEYFPVAKYINRIKQSQPNNWRFLLVPLQLLLVGGSYLLGSLPNLGVFLIIYFVKILDIRIRGMAHTAPQRKKIKTAGKQKIKAIKKKGKQERKSLWVIFKKRWFGFLIFISYFAALVYNWKLTLARTALVFEGLWWSLCKIGQAFLWVFHLFN